MSLSVSVLRAGFDYTWTDAKALRSRRWQLLTQILSVIICLIYAFLIDSIFAHTESPEDEEEFFYALTGNKRVVQITKEGESDQQIDQAVNLTLYRYDMMLSTHILFSLVLSPLWLHDGEVVRA